MRLCTARGSQGDARAEKPASHGNRDRVGLVLNAELAEDALLVVLDGLWADAERSGDLARRVARSHQREHLDFPPGEAAAGLGWRWRGGDREVDDLRPSRRLPNGFEDRVHAAVTRNE